MCLAACVEANQNSCEQVKGYFIPQASEIKKAVNVPVIGVGGITDAEFADKLVREGKVDLVAVGRAFWRDNKWAEKALETLNTMQSSVLI